MKKITLIALLSFCTYHTQADDSFLKIKNHLLSKCLNLDGEDMCKEIQAANSHKQLSAFLPQVSSLASSRDKALLDRISTMECCLSIHNGDACHGLKFSLRKKSCECRKRLLSNTDINNCMSEIKP